MKFRMKIFFMVLILCMCPQFNGSGNALDGIPPSANPPTRSLDGPVVQIDETAYAFGNVKGQDEIEHTFPVKNLGTTDLEITKVQVS